MGRVFNSFILDLSAILYFILCFCHSSIQLCTRGTTEPALCIHTGASMYFIVYAATDYSSHPISLPAVYSVLKELFTMLYLSRRIIGGIHFSSSSQILTACCQLPADFACHHNILHDNLCHMKIKAKNPNPHSAIAFAMQFRHDEGVVINTQCSL